MSSCLKLSIRCERRNGENKETQIFESMKVHVWGVFRNRRLKPRQLIILLLTAILFFIIIIITVARHQIKVSDVKWDKNCNVTFKVVNLTKRTLKIVFFVELNYFFLIQHGPKQMNFPMEDTKIAIDLKPEEVKTVTYTKRAGCMGLPTTVHVRFLKVRSLSVPKIQRRN